MNPTRRDFLRGILAAGSAPLFLPAHIFGANGTVSPSNKITVGFVGTGDHGRAVNLASILTLADVEVVALCDVDRKHLGLAAEMVTRSGAAPPERALYRDWRDVIARPDIDAVCISTPDHWHTPIAMAALRAGKDVLCEKPTVTIREGQLLAAAVRRYGRVYQASTEDRALPMYHRMAELVRNGAIGRLHTIRVQLPSGNLARRVVPIREDPVPPELDYDMWLGPAPLAPYQPERVHFNFRWIQAYSGGMLTDWGCHQVDTAQWANNTEHTGPVSVEGTCVFGEGLYDTAWDFELKYVYRNGVQLRIENTGTGLRFEGDKGWVGNTAWRRPVEASSPEILDAIVPPDGVHLYTEPAREHRNFIDCVRSRRDPYFPVEKLHRLGSLLHCGNICLKLGRKLNWNPDQEEFVGDEAANRLRARAMREPWHL
ncbi:MAG: Gfo/Idh/MocA family oxidoreductase [Opitutaceae bacterium]|nr:Gfo/Idh/MocA family oxidoreductase [Opitutaceae bacterium]